MLAQTNPQILRQPPVKTGLLSYLRHARPMVALTSPVLYAGVAAFALVDLFASIFQAVCFPVYGIPKVKRSAYFSYDRARLEYLNALERLNCLYCSYVNGVCAFVTEVAARTEQHWCPIRHGRELPAEHSRYRRFFDYANATDYRQHVERVRRDFSDLAR